MQAMDRSGQAARALRLRTVALALPLIGLASGVWSADRTIPARIDQLVKSYAAAYNVPLDLARRVIKRESGFNPRAQNSGNFGLMQIRAATARGLGYRGTAEGLLVAETNLAYGMAYLANALMVARGDQARADRYFQTGFYYEAKRANMLARMIGGCEFKVLGYASCDDPARPAGPAKSADPAMPIVADNPIIPIPVAKPAAPIVIASAPMVAVPVVTTASIVALPVTPKASAAPLPATVSAFATFDPVTFDPWTVVNAPPPGPIPPLPRSRPVITVAEVVPPSAMILPRPKPKSAALR